MPIVNSINCWVYFLYPWKHIANPYSSLNANIVDFSGLVQNGNFHFCTMTLSSLHFLFSQPSLDEEKLAASPHSRIGFSKTPFLGIAVWKSRDAINASTASNTFSTSSIARSNSARFELSLSSSLSYCLCCRTVC